MKASVYSRSDSARHRLARHRPRARGPDGDLWFTEQASPGGTADQAPTGIAVGGDGNVWLTEAGAPGAIVRISPAAVPPTPPTVGGLEVPGAKRPATRSPKTKSSDGKTHYDFTRREINPATPIVWRPVDPNLNLANDRCRTSPSRNRHRSRCRRRPRRPSRLRFQHDHHLARRSVSSYGSYGPFARHVAAGIGA